MRKLLIVLAVLCFIPSWASEPGQPLDCTGGSDLTLQAGNDTQANSNGLSWMQLFPGVPPAHRFEHSLIYDPIRHRGVLFGGRACPLSYFNDVWELSLGPQPQWTQLFPLGPLPSPRKGHFAIYDPVRDRMIIFGGNAIPTLLDDVWALTLGDDPPVWEQIVPSGNPPQARQLGASIYDPVRDRMIIFGGSVCTLDDTWALSLGEPAWEQIITPSGSPDPRGNVLGVYDPLGDRMLVIGGDACDSGVPYDELWELSFSGTDVWTQIEPVGITPPPRSAYGAIYDPINDSIVMFGGNHSQTLSDTWILQLRPQPMWFEPPVVGAPVPNVAGARASIYDPTGHRMILVKRPGASGNCHLPATTWALELCGSFSPLGHYGNPISPPLCTRDSDTLSGDLFYSEALGLLRSPNDSFYLSAEADGFAPLVVDDAVDMDGSSTGLGPYGVQPGVPPFKLGVPIEENLVPLPAHDVTDLVPLGQNSVLFQFLDTQGEIYGNTPLYLVRDCGIYLEKGVSTTLNWVSHDVEINGLQSDLNVATGLLSEFLADQDFSRACILGSFIDTTQAEDTRPDPPVGDGYYYLVSGTCAKPIGYGDSSAGPRKGLPPAAPCP